MRHAFLCAFLCRRCTTTTWKCLFSRFLEEVNTKRRFSKSFEKILELNSRKIHQIENLTKRHGIRDTNFKTARIHLLDDVFSHFVIVAASHVWCHKQTLDKRNYRSNYLSSGHFIDRAEYLFMWWFSYREKYRIVLPLQLPHSQRLYLKVRTLPLRREKPWERGNFLEDTFSYAGAVKCINLYIIYGIQDILCRNSLK